MILERINRRTVLIIGAAAAAAACGVAAQPRADVDLEVQSLARGLRAPWGLCFLPDGAALLTEKYGGVRRFRDGVLSPPLPGGPANVRASGQSGLLDIATDPRFAENRLLYLSFFEAQGGRGRLALFRARLEGAALRDGAVIFRGDLRGGTNHPGGRICFLEDETLLVFVGVQDGDRDRALDLASGLGKTHRITRAGQAPEDNPFVARAGAQATIFTYGHRNAMGLARDPEGGALWLHENGPRGGDELNLLRPGGDYGWPRVTYGREYSGAQITDLRTAPGVVSPVTQWTPSTAPSGLCVYRGALFPQWRGDLFIGMLAGRRIERIRVRDGVVSQRQPLLQAKNARIRDVREGPDGALYALTDDDRNGELLRLAPA